MLLQKH
jgi:hypothetical protein